MTIKKRTRRIVRNAKQGFEQILGEFRMMTKELRMTATVRANKHHSRKPSRRIIKSKGKFVSERRAEKVRQRYYS